MVKTAGPVCYDGAMMDKEKAVCLVAFFVTIAGERIFEELTEGEHNISFNHLKRGELRQLRELLKNMSLSEMQENPFMQNTVEGILDGVRECVCEVAEFLEDQ